MDICSLHDSFCSAENYGPKFFVLPWYSDAAEVYEKGRAPHGQPVYTNQTLLEEIRSNKKFHLILVYKFRNYYF